VTRFCGGPVESESSVFAPNGEIVGCTVDFACYFLSVFCPRRPIQCRIRFSILLGE
jgi:hypothetical protein